jgi:hypothetical protein
MRVKAPAEGRLVFFVTLLVAFALGLVLALTLRDDAPVLVADPTLGQEPGGPSLNDSATGDGTVDTPDRAGDKAYGSRPRRSDAPQVPTRFEGDSDKTVRIRLLDGDAGPLRDASVRLDWVTTGYPPDAARLFHLRDERSGLVTRVHHGERTTDREGRLEWSFRFGRRLDPAHATLRVVFGSRDEELRAATVELEAYRFDPAIVDLGDVVLTPGRLLVSGRVVDENGTPISGARLQPLTAEAVSGEAPDSGLGAAARGRESSDGRVVATAWSESSGRRSAGYLGFPGGLPPLDPELLALATTTDEEGEFEVIARPGQDGMFADGLFLRAEAEGRETRWLAVSLGAALRLELRGIGSLQGTVLLPAGVSVEWIRVDAVPLFRSADDAAASIPADVPYPDVDMIPVDDRGVRVVGFRAQRLHAGRYDVVVSLGYGGAEIARIRSVACDPTASRPDERLRSIDLRGKIHEFEIRAVDETGRPVPPGGLLFVRDGTTWQRFPWNRTLRTFASRSVVDVLAFSRTHRARLQSLSPEAATLTAERLGPIVLSFPGLRDVVGADAHVVLVSRIETHAPIPDGLPIDVVRRPELGHTRWDAPENRTAIDRDGRVELGEAFDGSYRLTLEIWRTEPDPLASLDSDADFVGRIDLGVHDLVREPNARPRTIEVDPARVRAALDGR